MNTKSTYTAVHAAFGCCVGFIVSTALLGQVSQHPYLFGIATVAALWLGVSIAIARRFQEVAEQDWQDSLASIPYPPVDVWGMQRELMTISGQHLPTTPMLTKGTLLYFALALEELGETASALTYCMADIAAHDNERTREEAALLNIRRLIMESGFDLRQVSQSVRDHLGSVSDPFQMPMTIPAATELLDGTTDVVVVTAGMCLASGLPGPEGYKEVVGSNLSKANP